MSLSSIVYGNSVICPIKFECDASYIVSPSGLFLDINFRMMLINKVFVLFLQTTIQMAGEDMIITEKPKSGGDVVTYTWHLTADNDLQGVR